MISDRELIHNWQQAVIRLVAAQKTEMRWRILNALRFFPNPTLGTNTSGDGALKLVSKENVTIEKDAAKLTASLNTLWKLFPDEQAKLALLVEWKPALNKPAYESLSEAAKLAFAPMITIKVATPSLKLANDASE